MLLFGPGLQGRRGAISACAGMDGAFRNQGLLKFGPIAFNLYLSLSLLCSHTIFLVFSMHRYCYVCVYIDLSPCSHLLQVTQTLCERCWLPALAALSAHPGPSTQHKFRLLRYGSLSLGTSSVQRLGCPGCRISDATFGSPAS